MSYGHYSHEPDDPRDPVWHVAWEEQEPGRHLFGGKHRRSTSVRAQDARHARELVISRYDLHSRQYRWLDVYKE